MPDITEGTYISDLVKYEHEAGRHCRGIGTIVSGAGVLAIGTVLGLISVGAAATVVAGTNTGNGVLTKDATTPVLQGAMVGAYKITCITAAANGGVFRVENPAGDVLGDVAVGSTFEDDIKFAIADGSADFVVGDSFTYTVAAGSGKYDQLDPAASNGSEVAAAVLLKAVDATSADVTDALLLERGPCGVSDAALVWPVGISAGNKSAAIAQLKGLGINVQKGA